MKEQIIKIIKCSDCRIEYPLDHFISEATICKECNEKKKLRILKVIKVITILALLRALVGNPYLYYQVLRWIVCGVAGYSVLIAVQRKMTVWIWIYGAIAFVFNPIFPLHFDKFRWQGIDVMTVVVFFISIFEDPRKQKTIFELLFVVILIAAYSASIIGGIIHFSRDPLNFLLTTFFVIILPFGVLYCLFGRMK